MVRSEHPGSPKCSASPAEDPEPRSIERARRGSGVSNDKPRELCPACQRPFPLNPDGSMQIHWPPALPLRPGEELPSRKRCPGPPRPKRAAPAPAKREPVVVLPKFIMPRREAKQTSAEDLRHFRRLGPPAAPAPKPPALSDREAKKTSVEALTRLGLTRAEIHRRTGVHLDTQNRWRSCPCSPGRPGVRPAVAPSARPAGGAARRQAPLDWPFQR